MGPLIAGTMPVGDGQLLYMIFCTHCKLPVPIPHPTERDRADWATNHTATTRHNAYRTWEEPR